MSLDIRVIYKVPSKERLFLGSGWSGVRDVRGPYLSAPTAEIIIDNWALLSKVVSSAELILSVSSRLKADELFVRATGDFGSSQIRLEKNHEATLIARNILCDPARTHTTIILKPAFDPEGKIATMAGTLDIVAIDEFRRFR